MSVKGLEMLRKHMSHYDFNPDRALLLGNVLYYLKQAEGEVAELESENKKLRELVRDVNMAAHMLCEAWEGSCSKEADGMSLHAACPIGDTNELCVFGKLYDRMRELGVGEDG